PVRQNGLPADPAPRSTVQPPCGSLARQALVAHAMCEATPAARCLPGPSRWVVSEHVTPLPPEVCHPASRVARRGISPALVQRLPLGEAAGGRQGRSVMASETRTNASVFCRSTPSGRRPAHRRPPVQLVLGPPP